MERQRGTLRWVKQHVFEYIFMLDSNRLEQWWAVWLMVVLQLGVLHYFYFHPNHPVLNNYSLFTDFFSFRSRLMPNLTPFSVPTFSLAVLALYPLVGLLAFIIKLLGPNKILVILLQIFLYLHPLLFIKITIQLSNPSNSSIAWATAPLALLSLFISALIMVLAQKHYRLLEIPIILLLEGGASSYLILVILACRLAFHYYLFWPGNPHLLGTLFQTSLLTVVLLCHLGTDQLLNYVSFLVIVLGTLAFGVSQLNKVNRKADLYHHLDRLQDDPLAPFQVYKLIEQHQAECLWPGCACQGVLAVGEEEIGEWGLQFEQTRLRRGTDLEGRVLYAMTCMDRHEYRLSGVVKVTEYQPSGLVEQYQVFRICSHFQLNLRKQDRNYRYGEPYLAVQEQVQRFKDQVNNIVKLVRDFWALIVDFDGSTKFLQTILKISRAIAELRASFDVLQLRYDEQTKEFRYVYELFHTLILNEPPKEDQDLTVPEQEMFLVTHGSTIANANNHFAGLVGVGMNQLLGKSYYQFVPEAYRDLHRSWADEYVDEVQLYADKALPKCIALDFLQVRHVAMSHRILPRFSQGLQVFTSVLPQPSDAPNHPYSFVFIVEKESFRIESVSGEFFLCCSFKNNHKNFIYLKDRYLSEVFSNFTPSLVRNPTRQTFLSAEFIDEFTTMAREESIQPTHSIRPKRLGEWDLLYQYQILDQSRESNPYMVVRFHPKNVALPPPAKQDESSSSQASVEGDGQQLDMNQLQGKIPGFCVPYYMLIVLVVIHVLFVVPSDDFNQGMGTLVNEYTFFVDFDYSVLQQSGIWVGENRLQRLKQLWIGGSGGHSQSFNALRRTVDSHFTGYFEQQVAVRVHNELYAQVHKTKDNIVHQLWIFGWFLLGVVVLGLVHSLVDFWISARYMLRIEKQVGMLLLQFVVVSNEDVLAINKLIDKFSTVVLNLPPLNSNSTDSEAEQSLNELIGTGKALKPQEPAESANKSPTQLTPPLVSSGNSNQGKRRLSINSLNKKIRVGSYNMPASNADEQIRQRKDAIKLFRDKYSDWKFILTSNIRLFLMSLAGSLLVIGVLIVAVFLLTTPLNEYQKQLRVVSGLYDYKIGVLKSLQELQAGSSLQPHSSLSDLLHEAVTQAQELQSILSFKGKLDDYLSQDVCSTTTYNCTLLSNTTIYQYGINIMNQYIEEFLRVRNMSMLVVDNSQNRIIQYQQYLLKQLLSQAVDDSSAYHKSTINTELYVIILGLAVMLAGLILSHLALQVFKNRIEDSNHLLRIIPKHIRQQHLDEHISA